MMTSPELFSQTQQSSPRATENIVQLIWNSASHDCRTYINVCNLRSSQRDKLMEMTRRETRSGCGDPAAVTVSLDTSTVMLQLCRICHFILSYYVCTPNNWTAAGAVSHFYSLHSGCYHTNERRWRRRGCCPNRLASRITSLTPSTTCRLRRRLVTHTALSARPTHIPFMVLWLPLQDLCHLRGSCTAVVSHY